MRPLKLLKFKKNDLVIKQGDYGISIYKIIRGRVELFKEYEDREIPLTTLGPGEIIGEMSFLNRSSEVRSASARALENLEMEVWHTDDLLEQYEQISPAIKYLSNQALGLLTKMNNVMIQISSKKEKEEQPKREIEPSGSNRNYYRKRVAIRCIYEPIDGSLESPINLKGSIKDISMSGLNLVIHSRNLHLIPHNVGDRFHLNTKLPNGKRLRVNAEIITLKTTKDSVSLGMRFLSLSDEMYGARKTLGFFLLPT